MKILLIASPTYKARSAVDGLGHHLRRFGHEVDLGKIGHNDERERGADGARTAILQSEDVRPDIIHVWEAGKSERRFSSLRRFPKSTIIVHLAPGIAPELIAQAGAFTAPTQELVGYDLPARPHLILSLGADPKLFFPRAKDCSLLAKLRIPLNSLVISFAGNVTARTALEVRSLYLALAMLNRQGVPTTLVRAGRDESPFLGADDQWARKYAIELGHLDHAEIPRVLSLADLLIQPGPRQDNDPHWLPSTLSEIFRMGRPVILSRSGIGRRVDHLKEGWVLEKANASEMVQAVRALRSDTKLAQRLGEGALRFYQEHFDWETAARKLDVFYRELWQNRRNRDRADTRPLSVPTGL